MTLLGNTRLVVACVVLSIVLISHHAAADECCEETSHDSASAWRQCALGEGEGGRSVGNTSLLNLSQNKLLKRKGQTLTPRQSALGESAVVNDQFSSSTYAKVLLQEQTKCPDVTLKCPTSKAKPQHRKGRIHTASQALVSPLTIVKRKALQEAGGLLGILEGKFPALANEDEDDSSDVGESAGLGRGGGGGAMRYNTDPGGAMRMRYNKIPEGGGCVQANLINHCIPAGLQVGHNAEKQRRIDTSAGRGWFDKDTHKQYHIFCDKSNSATVHKSILTAPGRGNTPRLPKSVLSSRYTPLGATEAIKFTKLHSVGNVLGTLTCKDPDDVRVCSVKVCKKVLKSEVSNSYTDTSTFWFKVKNRQLSRNRQLLGRQRRRRSSQRRRRSSQRRRRSSQQWRTRSSQWHWESVSGVQFAVKCGKRWVARVCSPINGAANSPLQCVSAKTCGGPVKIGIRKLWNSLKNADTVGWKKFPGTKMWEENNPRVKFWLDKLRSEKFSKKLLEQMTEMQCANDCALF